MVRIFSIVVLSAIFLPFGKAAAQVPAEQMVPLPDFAGHNPEYSQLMQAMFDEVGGKEIGRGGTGMDYVYYESREADVLVYTTSHSLDEVREIYFDRIIEHMLEQGIPPDAVPQLERFLETEVFDDIETEPMAQAEPDMMETYFRGEGAETALQWLECYRALYPELQHTTSRTFLIEMDDQRLQQRETGVAPAEITLVEVEVQQPFVDPIGCAIDEGTAITYSIHRMVAADDE